MAAAAGQAAAALQQLEELRNVVLPFVGLDNTGHIPNRETTRFIELHGLESVEDFSTYNPKDAKDLIESYNEGIRPNQNRRRLGMSIRKRLMGTIWWCFDKARRQEQLDVALLTEQSLEEALAECEEWMRELDSGVKEPTTLRQFNNQAAMDFDDWDTDMVTRLRQKKGAQRTGMGYIARRSPEPGFDPIANAQSEIEKLEYQLPLHGPKFQADNTKVFAMVQAATTGTIAAPWIEDYAPLQDGRASIKALRSHYEGVDMITKREATAQRTLDNAIYTSERIMTFETFVTTLMKAFTLHAKQGQESTDLPCARLGSWH